MLRGGAVEALTVQLGAAGPWHERLPHFRMEFTPSRGAELQTEYFVPRRHSASACNALLGIGERIAPVLQVSEIRSVAADQLWLSGSYQADVVAFHFTWVLDQPGVFAGASRDRAGPATLRRSPALGQVLHDAVTEAARGAPGLADFVRLRDQVDPSGKFGNAFLDRCFDSAWVRR